MKYGCIILVTILAILLGAIQLYFSSVNFIAFRIAKHECTTQPQIEIVDRALWNKAAAAANDTNFPDRISYAFDIDYSNFDEFYQDKFIRALYRATNPVRVRSKIVAYTHNTYVYAYSFGVLLSGGFSIPDYQCMMDANQFSPEYKLILAFNKFGRL